MFMVPAPMPTPAGRALLIACSGGDPKIDDEVGAGISRDHRWAVFSGDAGGARTHVAAASCAEPGIAAAANRMSELRACSLISVVPFSVLVRRIFLLRRNSAQAMSMMAFVTPGRGLSAGS